MAKRTKVVGRLAAVALAAVIVANLPAGALPTGGEAAAPTTTPIKHIVVLFDENISFDHYFGTYPEAENPKDEPKFVPKPGTPEVKGLTEELLTNNPNSANPFRFGRDEAVTCDMDHNYTAEQAAFDNGKMDRFVEFTRPLDPNCDAADVMGYYDGNTVTAMWNYAQRFAMNDNSFNTTFGPSTPGALNLISGQTHGATPESIPLEVANGTVIGDPDPAFDDCSGDSTVAMSGKNVGNLLTDAGATWGWFEGGFRPSEVAEDGTATCDTSHKNIAGESSTDYIPHHQPFMYYESTSNPHHKPPSSVEAIGNTDEANHQYDLKDFWAAANAGNLPAVSFLKAAAYQDGHAGYSDPLDEQHFLVKTINRIQTLAEWKSTAVVIAYDDSDGWYDHVMGPIVSPSMDSNDALTAPGVCGDAPNSEPYQDRCGFGPRLPLMIISPWAKRNFVDHTLTDQTSILKFIEDNWNLGRIGDDSFDEGAGSLLNMFDFTKRTRGKLILKPKTGLPSR